MIPIYCDINLFQKILWYLLRNPDINWGEEKVWEEMASFFILSKNGLLKIK
jgi:hypothetical protein